MDCLFSRESARVIPQNTVIANLPFLAIQEFGPFKIERKLDLLLFAAVVPALLIWQLDGFNAWRLLAKARRALDDKMDL